MTAQGVTWLGLVANTALSIAKIAVGILFRSQALLADGLHSGTDLLTDAIVLAGLRVSARPADRDHPYGHHRVATLVAMFVGAILLLTALWIIYRAIVTLHAPHDAMRATLPFWIALTSVPVKELLYQLTVRIGRKTDNIALMANAWHHRSDALTSIAAAAGLAGVAFGGPDWAFLDHVTAIVLSAFLIIAAAKIIREAGGELIDQAPDEKVLASIEEIVMQTPGVKSYHALRARKLGGKIEMDLHIQVDPELSVHAGHDIAGAVSRRIREADCGVRETIVHIEPFEITE